MRRHVYSITTLLLLATIVQTYVAWRAIVPAQDAVRFVALAQRIETHGLREAWRESEQAPFAALVACVHRPRRWEPWAPTTGMNCVNWATSAQVAAAIPAVLSVVPVYLLLTLWLGGRSALLGSILFCLCPSVARLGGDGLCDSTHLLLAAGSLALAMAYLRRLTSPPADENRRWSVEVSLAIACGMLWAAAVLVRPEALVLAPAIWASVAIACWGRASGTVIPRVVVSLGCFVLAAVGTFAIQTRFTNTSTAPLATFSRMFSHDQVPRPDIVNDGVADDWRLANGRPMAFPFKEYTTTSRFHGLLSAAGEMFNELPQTLGWATLPMAVATMWWRRRHWRIPPEFMQWAVLVLVVCSATWYAASVGYLSARHLVLGVVPVVGWSGWGCRIACRGLAKKMRFPSTGKGSAWSIFRHMVIRPSVVAVLLGVAALATIDLPLHASRIAHRRTARWLNGGERAPGAILDTRGWTMLYSDRPTYRYDEAPVALLDPALAYIVVEQRDLDFDSPRGRTLREVLIRGGTRRAVLPGPVGQPGKAVLVYRWNATRFAHTVADVLAN